jgi:hypothetical protein
LARYHVKRAIATVSATYNHHEYRAERLAAPLTAGEQLRAIVG